MKTFESIKATISIINKGVPKRKEEVCFDGIKLKNGYTIIIKHSLLTNSIKGQWVCYENIDDFKDVIIDLIKKDYKKFLDDDEILSINIEDLKGV